MGKRGKQRGRPAARETPPRAERVSTGDTAPVTPGPSTVRPEPSTATPEPSPAAPTPGPVTPPSESLAAAPPSSPLVERAAGNGLTGLYLHLHPRLVRRRTGSLGATLGLGLATLVAIALTTLSGLLLMVYYVPSVDRAHASVQDLLALVPLGRFVRNLHRWAGHAAVAFALLHLLRTFLWTSYRGSHARVWLVGAGLLFLTLATSYSGYLLPWDQDAYWTITVGTSLVGYVPLVGEWLQQALLGSDTVGQAALTRFYVLHVAVLPALGLLFLALHLFRLRRAGGLARPAGASGPGEELVPASPYLTRREAALSLLVTLLLCGIALAVDARLGPAPDLLRPDDPPKAPWFLSGIQEMVSYSAGVGGVLFPGLLAALIALLPWLDGATGNQGARLHPPAARLAVPLAVVVAASSAALAVRWWGDPQAGQLSLLNPASLAGLAAVAAALIAGGIWRERGLLLQPLLAGLLAALVVFSLVGWYGRGPDWKLAYHPGPGRGLASASEAGLASASEASRASLAAGPADRSRAMQLTTPDGEVDRCVTCHQRSLALDGRASSHPRVPGHADLTALGCVTCHGGQGRRLDGGAHLPVLGDGPRPFLRGSLLQARCARCHLPGLAAAPALARGIREYLDAGCSGCHQPGRLDQGIGPDLRRLGRRSEAELRRAILDPEHTSPKPVMWSLRWRFDEKTTEGQQAISALLTALIAFADDRSAFRSSWAHPQARSDQPCAGCHLGATKTPSGTRHRCVFLPGNSSLRCAGCHQGPEVRVASGSLRECPQRQAGRPTCTVCHLRELGSPPRDQAPR